MSGGFLKNSVLALLALAALGCARVSDADAVVIMPLGDSITWGWSNSKTRGGYRSQLYKELRDAGLPVSLTGTQRANPSLLLRLARQQQHEGHISYRISEILANLDGDDGRPDSNGGHWLTGKQPAPDIILLHIGTNDILHRKYEASAELPERLEALVEKIFALAPDTHLFVSNIIPYNDPSQFAAQDFLNEALENEIVPKVARQGRKITFVDQRSNFLGADGKVMAARVPDGVHPDKEGYDLIGRTWARAILSEPAYRMGKSASAAR